MSLWGQPILITISNRFDVRLSSFCIGPSLKTEYASSKNIFGHISSFRRKMKLLKSKAQIYVAHLLTFLAIWSVYLPSFISFVYSHLQFINLNHDHLRTLLKLSTPCCIANIGTVHGAKLFTSTRTANSRTVCHIPMLHTRHAFSLWYITTIWEQKLHQPLTRISQRHHIEYFIVTPVRAFQNWSKFTMH